MLDQFLSVVLAAETKQVEEIKLARVLEGLDEEDLRKLASGEAKLSFGACEDWLEKYKGTPLFEQAVALERAELESEVARTKAMASAPSWDEMNKTQDGIRVQKKMLDLELLESQNGMTGAGSMGAGQLPMSVTPIAPAGEEGAPEVGDAVKAAASKDERAMILQSDKKRVRDGGLPLLGSIGANAGAVGGLGLGYLAGKHVHKLAPAGSAVRSGLEAGAPFLGAALGTLPGAAIGHKVQTSLMSEKEAAARFEKAALSNDAITKAVANTVAKGNLTPERAGRAAALGRKVIAKGSKMLQGGFNSGKTTALGTGGSLIRQGSELTGLASKMAMAKEALDMKGLGATAAKLMKNRNAVMGAGAALGAAGGAIAGGPDHRLSGALGGAAVGAGAGHAASGIASGMGKGLKLEHAAKAYGGQVADQGKSLVQKVQGAVAKPSPQQYAVTPRPVLPAAAPVQAHASNVLDHFDRMHGKAASARFSEAVKAIG